MHKRQIAARKAQHTHVLHNEGVQVLGAFEIQNLETTPQQ